MSLFGDDDAAAPPSTRSGGGAKATLFDDGSAAAPSAKTSSSMFGDPASPEDSSPWAGFTPKKKAGRGAGMVKSLLADARIPELYVDTWDTLAAGRSAIEGEEARDLLGKSGIGKQQQDRIWELVSGGAGESVRIGRGEFNVLLALIGLAQEGEELSLDAVDERKAKLPTPSLPGLKKAAPEPPATPQQGRPGAQSLEPSTAGAKGFSGGFGDADPWGSPDVHKGHNHANGVSGAQPQRTTSTFTTTAAAPSEGNGNGVYGDVPSSAGDPGSSWGATNSYTATSAAGFGGADGDGDGEGFGDEGVTPTRRSAAPRHATSKGAEETVTVAMLEEKEGMFLFQHRNYEVSSIRRNSKVIRRYSDFVWLLDCLHKRYPFRQLPLLPPKRVAINGNHIAADGLFIEKRRRGLARFANALVRHPVLREEQLVVMFLTVPTELAVWRKQATISVQEEFVGRSLPPNLEDSLPQNLQDTFETVRSGVRRSADLYINLCTLLERLCKRKEAISAEYGRFALNLTSITETTTDMFAIDTNDVPLLNEGIKATAKYLGTSQALLDDESRAWDEGYLEDLKSIRDGLVSLRDLFERRDRFSRDNIPQLEKRISSNESKLQTIKSKGDAAKPGEAEKVETAITTDKQSIVSQHARGIFIKQCVRDEVVTFQQMIWRISRAHQEWASERVKYAELQADCWRALVDGVEGMPVGE
nr:hypothetical protein B0A51_05290 [Rachicladosporium sp. CCFEE 5018]